MRPSSEELVARIVGQSQDVACELEVVDGASGASCPELAASQRAEAVLRVREPEAGGAYEVVVCDAVASREQARAVPTEHASGDALGASAAYEAVALVVRSALVDIAAEHDARREAQRALEAERARELAAREAAARAETRARARAVEADPEDEDEEEESDDADDAAALRDPAWIIAAGAELAAIGADAPELDLTARLLFALGPMHLGAGFSYGLPAKLELEGSELEIARHTLVLIASLPWRVSARATLDAGMQAGASALVRDTRSSTSGATPADSEAHWSAVLGVEIGAGLRFADPLGARLHLALDVLPGAPSYAVEDVDPSGVAARRTELASPSYVQPRAGITLFAAF